MNGQINIYVAPWGGMYDAWSIPATENTRELTAEEAVAELRKEIEQQYKLFGVEVPELVVTRLVPWTKYDPITKTYSRATP